MKNRKLLLDPWGVIADIVGKQGYMGETMDTDKPDEVEGMPEEEVARKKAALEAYWKKRHWKKRAANLLLAYTIIALPILLLGAFLFLNWYAVPLTVLYPLMPIILEAEIALLNGRILV